MGTFTWPLTNRITSYLTDENAWYLAVADELTGTTSHTYDGFNGSSTLSHPSYVGSQRRLSEARQWAQLGGDLVAARIRRELELHLGAPSPTLSLRFYSRTIREFNLTWSAMLGAVPITYTPFMDPELIRFVWPVPLEHVDHGFHDDVIARAFPEWAAIPYRPKEQPRPTRAFMREVNRDLLHVLRECADGSLLDRAALSLRTALGAVRGDSWMIWDRRASLTTYLAQLEAIVSGRGPMPYEDI